MTDRAQEIAEAARLARRAVALGGDDAFALSSGGNALAYVVCLILYQVGHHWFA